MQQKKITYRHLFLRTFSPFHIQFGMRCFLLFFLLIGLMACDDRTFFKAEKDISDGIWAYRDTVDFQFSVTDTTELYDMYALFTYADTFATQNVYLKLYTRFPDGKRLKKTRSFDLFDAAGSSTGSCSGHRCTARVLLQNNAYFNQAGEYVLTLEQFMRQDSLSGVVAVGLELERTGKKR
jgi:gliding motility-associated lipoprotein GldH